MCENNPLVSISCITYNHAPYIRQCLDGFLKQKTDFVFEILIHDDCSTDGTTEIIKEYEKKYPQIIKALYEDENQWIKGRRGSAVFNFPRAKGKYIAMCEGDDYWIDSFKLQKQVDFMELNPECSMTFHKVKIDLSSSKENDRRFSLYKDLEEREYSMSEIFKTWCVPTASVVFRSDIQLVYDSRFIVGDNPLFLSCAKMGKVFCISIDEMAVYRLLDTGTVARGFDSIRQIEHFIAIKEHFGDIELNDLIKEKILSVYVDAFLKGRLGIKSLKMILKLCMSHIDLLPLFIIRLFDLLKKRIKDNYK